MGYKGRDRQTLLWSKETGKVVELEVKFSNPEKAIEYLL